MTTHFTLRRETRDGLFALVPEIGGRRLIDLVAAYETARGYAPSGGYGGIVPAHFNFGPLDEYYLGTAAHQWPRPGAAWVLGCECGEVGCWPLTTQITVSDDTVTWSGFSQPHRTDWDYTGFGPFEFDRTEYERAVASAVAEYPTRASAEHRWGRRGPAAQESSG